MKRPLLILIISCVLLVMVVLFFIFNKKNIYVIEKETAIAPNTQNIEKPDGSAGNSSGVLFQGDNVIGNGEDYEIISSDYEGKKSFIVFIKKGDPFEARKIAEKAFLTSLGASESEACAMDVSLFVSEDVDQKLSGKNYGLSFCPDGKDLDAIKGL